MRHTENSRPEMGDAVKHSGCEVGKLRAPAIHGNQCTVYRRVRVTVEEGDKLPKGL